MTKAETISLDDLSHISVEATYSNPRAIAQRRIYLARCANEITDSQALHLFAEIGYPPAEAINIMRQLTQSMRRKEDAFDTAILKERLIALPVSGKVRVDGLHEFESARRVAYWLAKTHPGYSFVGCIEADRRGGTIIRYDAALPRDEALAKANALPARRGRKRGGS